MTSEQATARVSVLRLVLVIFFTRTVLNIGYRAVYPFLPFIASDLGISFQSAAQIVQARNLVGLAAPLFGPLSDHYGRRTMMLAGLVISVIASLTIGFITTFVLAIIAIAVLTLGRAMFEPSQQAYLGDRVPYAERGRAMSLSELSWAAASLAGLPAFGIVVHFFGWRSAFFLLGTLLILVLLLTRWGLPTTAWNGRRPGQSLWRQSFGMIVREPVARGALATSVVMMACNENVNVVYAEWMKGNFLLDAIALGTVAAALGVAEFGGEFLSSVYVDRIGKHRFVLITAVLSGAAYVLLPFLGSSPILGTLGLALVFFFFETCVVSMLPLISEIVPSARATLLSLNLAAALLGRTIGSFSGPFLFLHQGFLTNGLVSGAGMLVVVALWQFFVSERALAAA